MPGLEPRALRSGPAAASPSPLDRASFDLKVNRKARKAALRGALSNHVEVGTLAVMESGVVRRVALDEGSAVAFLAEWGKELPIVVVAQPDEDVLAKSFRNVDGVLVLDPTTLEVGAVVWARSLLMTESALARVKEIAQ